MLEDEFPKTPIVVGRLRGGEPGPTVVLNGHLDTVPIPHEWPRLDGDTIYGRGTADMKGALACAAEAARVLAERGSFPGELVIVAIGLHEAPGGRGEDLTHLLEERGFTADLGVVCELGGPTLPVAHLGCATFEITIRREGMVTHELQTAAGTPHPILVAARVIDAIRARNEELAAVEHEWVGPESYFLGEVHGGDFYNRYPVECRFVGTRRWAPGNTLAQVEEDFRALLAPIAAESGCAIDLDLQLVRGAYEIDPEHRLVVALREAYQRRHGRRAAAHRRQARRRRRRSSTRRGSRPSTTARWAPARTGTSSRSTSRSSSGRRRSTSRCWSVSGPELRAAVRRLPLAGAGAREPRRRRLRAPPARRGRDRGHGRARGDAARHLRRALGRLEPARERAAGSRDRRGRSRRDRAAAAARDGGRAHRRLQARRDRGAALDALRPGRDGGAARRRGSGGRARRPRARGRGDDRRRPRAAGAAGGGVRPLRAGGDRGRRAGADRLHVRHDRAAEGRAARPSRPVRPPAGVRALARLLPAAGRPDLVAGGLGLDGRPLRRADARPLPRPARARVPDDEVRSRADVRPDPAARRAQRLHARDGAADDGRARRPGAVAAHARERRRDGGGGDGGVVLRAAGREAERVLRPDGGEPADRELQPRGRRSPARWGGRTRATTCSSSTAR